MTRDLKNECMRIEKWGESKLQQLPPMALPARNIIYHGGYYISVSRFHASTNGTSNFQPRIRAKPSKCFGADKALSKTKRQNSKPGGV